MPGAANDGRMSTPRSVRVDIDLGEPGDPITGQVTDGTGRSTRFSGWIGLVSVIESVRAQSTTASHRTRDDGRQSRRATTPRPASTVGRPDEPRNQTTQPPVLRS